jgi:hypothetical protein
MPEFSASPPFPKTRGPLQFARMASEMNALHARLLPYVHASSVARANAWISAGDTGTASMAIWSHMNGVASANPGHRDAAPLDVGEFTRCVRLYAFMPEWHARRHEMGELSRPWQGLCEQWDELEASLLAESGMFYEKRLDCPQTHSRFMTVWASIWREPQVDSMSAPSI